MSNRFDRFTDFVIRFLSEHAMPGGKRTQQAAQCDENRKFAALSNQGKAQPVARLLENSEDIAEVYSRPEVDALQKVTGVRASDGSGLISAPERHSNPGFKVSEREIQRKEKLSQNRTFRPPAPKKYRELLCVDTACETVVASNRYGDQLCLCEGVGICKFCELIICGNCLLDESCPNAPCGSSKHRVICQ